MSTINRVGNKIGAWSFKPAQKSIEGQESRNPDTKKDDAEWGQSLNNRSNISDTALLEIIDKQNASKTIV